MATSSFDKEFIITDEKVVDQILDMMENTKPHCEYCMDEINLIGEWTKGGEFAKYMWIENNRIGLEVHHELGDSFLNYVKINYCPMCGRALSK